MAATAEKEIRNEFCRLADLTNEAAVERNLVDRLLATLGFSDQQICLKSSLEEIAVGKARGRKESRYRPDYALKAGLRVKCIIEAKAPGEKLDEWIFQPREYARFLNGQYPTGVNPVAFFMLTNGIKTLLFRSDQNDPILTLDFIDLSINNVKYKKLFSLISPDALRAEEPINEEVFLLEKPTLDQINTIFAKCHQYIHVKEGLSQQAAFMEFVKVVFLKLLSDKEIRKLYPQSVREDEIVVPHSEVRFSKHWIESRERDAANPLSTIQFGRLLLDMEKEIDEGKRKRVFNQGEAIDLKPQTIKYIVEKLEHMYLFGIDADLNGRLFETFLNATMRGKDLGQFFTPRSIVKLGLQLANPKVHALQKDGTFHTDTVVDACCGTGGFLIEALADMWQKADDNLSLSDSERDRIKRDIANDHILGVDFGKEPPLARIARLNMYLHGDGGSRIFQADALDKSLVTYEDEDAETTRQKRELKTLFDGRIANVVLTNPPFAKTYDRESDEERRILDDYRLSNFEQRTPSPRSVLKSSMMFIERYYDILADNGVLISILDDSLLGGKDFSWFRNFLRERFFVHAVISLPGDAFQRSNARVKTSLVILVRRPEGNNDAQPAAFMYPARFVGVDDPARQRTLSVDHDNRVLAQNEIGEIVAEYQSYLEGRVDARYLIAGNRLGDRLDVKSCLFTPGRAVSRWVDKEFDVVNIGEWLEPVRHEDDNTIYTTDCDDRLNLISVSYSGLVRSKEIIASDSKYDRLYRVSPGDLVVSKINAVHGAIGIVPEDFENGVITPSEYRVMRARGPLDIRVIWMLLRSFEARSEFLLTATGLGRTRVDWASLSALSLPSPPRASATQVAQLLEKARALEVEAAQLRTAAASKLDEVLDLNNDEALAIVQAFKPPD